MERHQPALVNVQAKPPSWSASHQGTNGAAFVLQGAGSRADGVDPETNRTELRSAPPRRSGEASEQLASNRHPACDGLHLVASCYYIVVRMVLVVV